MRRRGGPVAFVLSGGGSLGAVQVGMVRALYERGIVPDLLVATSVGAVNAAFIASRPPNVATADELAEVWCAIRRADVFPAHPIAGFLGFLGHRNSLVPNSGLRSLLERHVQIRRLRIGGSHPRGEYLPLTWHALQRGGAPRLERDSRARNEVAHRARHEDLAAGGPVGHPGADVYGEAADGVATHLTLARVQPGADLEAERPAGLADGIGAADGARWTVEGCQQAVAGGLDLAAAEAVDLRPGGPMERVHERAPAGVAERRRPRGGADDVHEEDRRQHAVDLDLVAHAGQKLSE